MFEIIDWLVIVVYTLLIFYIAFRKGKLSSDGSNHDELVREQYLANQSLTFTESICSIIATEVSALTFLGVPAFAFNKNFSFIHIYFGAIIGRLIIAKIFLPKIYNRGLTIYECMRGDNQPMSGQKMIASLYTFAKILSVGVRLFSGSILISHFLHVNLYVGLIIVTFVTFLYTLIGGLKAVVQTDILQMGLFVLGGLIAHFMIPQISGHSWIDLMSIASVAGKTEFFSWANLNTFIIGIFGGILFDMATHGVDQDFAQRLMANHSLKSAQKAIFFSSFVSISVGFLFLGIGALLWAHYQTVPFPASVQNADHLFSYFIVNHFPTGLKGLMVAGVLAATMSTLDSTINALCSCVYNDIFPHRRKRKLQTYFLFDNIVITVLLLGVAIVASTNDGLLLLGLKIQSWTAGALVALFVARLIIPKYFPFHMTAKNVVLTYICSISFVFLNVQILNWDWNLNVYFGAMGGLVCLKILSLVQPFKH